jgi:hypothetical protein
MEQLVSMCKRGDLFGVQEWVASGRSLSPGPGRFRTTPFRVALKTGFLSLIEVFLQSGIEDDERLRGLRNSVYSGREDIFELFIKYGADPHDVSFEDVLWSRHKPLIQRYVEIGVDWDEGNQIAHALARGQREFLGIYLDLRDNVPSAPKQAAMALREHCSKGRMRWVALLLWAGVDPRLPVPDLSYPGDEDFLGTALEDAVSSGHAEVVKKIGLDPAKDNPTELLGECWLANSPEIVRILLDAGGDPNAQTRYGVPMSRFVDGLAHAIDGPLANGSRAESALKCLELAASRGGRWRSELISGHCRFRRALGNISSHEAVRILHRLLDCGALEADGLKKFMSTPKMKALLASETMGIKRLRTIVGCRPEAIKRKSSPRQSPNQDRRGNASEAMNRA